jgi:hypothetical protein
VRPQFVKGHVSSEEGGRRVMSGSVFHGASAGQNLCMYWSDPAHDTPMRILRGHAIVMVVS